MSQQYQAIAWNRQKRIYDVLLVTGVTLYLTLFIGVSAFLFPYATTKTLIIRAAGSAAFLLLHVVLCIGPLCRLGSTFLPLLYNRRHLGVVTFLLGAIHSVAAIRQFHSLGDDRVAQPIRIHGTVLQIGNTLLLETESSAIASHSSRHPPEQELQASDDLLGKQF